MSDFGGLECFWSDLSKHPVCPHGPTLLFGKYEGDKLKQFYACSACRDRKLCPFYAEKDAKTTDARSKARKTEDKNIMPFYNHRKLFVRFNESMIQSAERRAYCYSCVKLVMFSERTLHSDHELRTNLSDQEMNNPTTILKPLSDVKKEAQYLFSRKATIEITDMLVRAGAKQVLCVGAPRIHEYITQNLENKMSSLLLDFDGRFHNFFGPLSYCWYNLFNHHFFAEEGAQTYRDFMTQNGGEDTFVICDPPFGGRVEAISQTLEAMVDQHKKWNGHEAASLKIMFVFPYFMESIIQRKSNPPGQEGGLKSLEMSDYKVDYENHPLFVTGSSGRKHGSPVRIFTNIGLKTLELPSMDGYRYCAKCEKWIATENRHCKKCGACTSKDGRRYRHCERCRRCVKPTWKHCETCDRCILESHKCGEKPRVTGRCHVCAGKDHTAKDCPKSAHPTRDESPPKRPNKKRKTKLDDNVAPKKKRKTSTTETRVSAVVKERKKKRDENVVPKKKTKTPTIATRVSAVVKERKKKRDENVVPKKKTKTPTTETHVAAVVKEPKKLNGTKKPEPAGGKKVKKDLRNKSNERSAKKEDIARATVSKIVANRERKNKSNSFVRKTRKQKIADET